MTNQLPPQTVKRIEVETQIGTAYGADFEENTWTFLMPDGFQVWAGQFAIVDKQVYDKLTSEAQRNRELVEALEGMVKEFEKDYPELATTEYVPAYTKAKQALKNYKE